MANECKVGMHGRMRRRIAAFGRAHTNRIVPLQSRKSISKDKYLRPLLKSGAITASQLETAIRGYNKTPSEFAWIGDVGDAVLDKADRAFFARYGRFPTEDSDFQLNGDYYRICRSLQHDWHYCDRQLEKLHSSDDEDTPSVRQAEQAEVLQEVQSVPQSKGSLWASGLVLAGGLVSAPILRMVIVKAFPGRVAGAALLVGTVWLILLVAGLALTLPRRSQKELRIRKCGKCGAQLSSEHGPKLCPNCGLCSDSETVPDRILNDRVG